MEKENKEPRRRDFVTLRGRQDKREDKCPLCEISEETLKRLKEAGKNKKIKQNPTKNNEN